MPPLTMGLGYPSTQTGFQVNDLGELTIITQVAPYRT
jgi:hypothetical protein